MQFIKLGSADRTQLLQSLARMPEELRADFAQLLQHDAAHRAEIGRWREHAAPGR